MADFTTYPSNAIAKAKCFPRDAVFVPQLDIVNALSGHAIGTVSVDPAWTVLRLKTEIANTLGIAAREQRILLSATTDAIDDKMILEEALARNDGPSLRLLRACVPEPPQRSAQQPITVDSCDGVCRVTWAVDAKKFSMTLKTFVSPSFQLDFGNQQKLTDAKLMVYTDEASLKQAGGKGHLQLKCDGCVDENLHISVRIGNEAKFSTPTEPFVHNFSDRGIWRSSSASAQQVMKGSFNFGGAVGASSKILISLTIQAVAKQIEL